MNEPPMGERPPFFSINIGHVLTLVAMLIGGGGAFYGLAVELKNVGYRVERIETAITQLTALSVITGRQDERLLALERRLTALEQKPH